MANMNIRTPRFYIDQVNYLLSRGAASTGFALQASGSNLITAYTAGSDAELFDMKPLNQCIFDTNGNIDEHILVTIDTSTTGTKKSFIAILNHNMDTASAKVRVSASNTKSHIQAVDMGSATAQALTEVVNGDTIASNICTPGTDGSTIVIFPETSLRYFGIQFEGSDSAEFDQGANNDLRIGTILIGEYFDMPQAPDMSLTRHIDFDTVTVQQSIGGQRYGRMISPGAYTSSNSMSPFVNSTSKSKIYGGRMSYDLKFSFLNSTDIMPDEYDNTENDDNVIDDIWNKTNGSHLPFIFSVDNASVGSDAESEHMFARFGMNELAMEQVAPDVFNVGMRIEQEF